VTGMPFTRALRVKNRSRSPPAPNAWDISPALLRHSAAKKDDVVAVTFWMRTLSSPDGRGSPVSCSNANDSPYTKSVTYTASAAADWKKFEVPFTMAETYSANAYNFSFWVTYSNQEVEIGGVASSTTAPAFRLLNSDSVPGLTPNEPPTLRGAPAAAARIERYRKGDLAVTVRDDAGNPSRARTCA
jgi:hypothetical protein